MKLKLDYEHRGVFVVYERYGPNGYDTKPSLAWNFLVANEVRQMAFREESKAVACLWCFPNGWSPVLPESCMEGRLRHFSE